MPSPGDGPHSPFLNPQSSAPSPLAEALLRWQAAAGPYWLYVCAAPFISAPQSLRVRRPSPVRSLLPEVLAPPRPEQHTAIFFDLPPAETLPATRAFNELGFIVVPIIQRWLAVPAVLACERLAADLWAYGMQAALPRTERGVAFLLDGERSQPPSLTLPSDRSESEGPTHRTQSDRKGGGDSTTLRRFDNRYSYPIDRFPPPAFLRAQGIACVDWVCPDGIALDLHRYARDLEDASLPLRVLVPHASPA